MRAAAEQPGDAVASAPATTGTAAHVRFAPDRAAHDRADHERGLAGYFLAGPLAWGGVGWLADGWLGTEPWLLGLGVAVGLGGALYLVRHHQVAAYRRDQQARHAEARPTS